MAKSRIVVGPLPAISWIPAVIRWTNPVAGKTPAPRIT